MSKFSSGPGVACLKVIKMVEYLNEKMGLLTRYNGYHMEKQNAQQDEALLDLEESSKMPPESGCILEAPEQASEDKLIKLPFQAKATISCRNKRNLW